MIRHGQMHTPQQDMDAWLRSLVVAFEETSVEDADTAPCMPMLSDNALKGVIAQLTQPMAGHRQAAPWTPSIAAHSPAICSRGWLPRSNPRSLAS
jgi:FPC/CPF motif-containing protein YcgG